MLAVKDRSKRTAQQYLLAAERLWDMVCFFGFTLDPNIFASIKTIFERMFAKRATIDKALIIEHNNALRTEIDNFSPEELFKLTNFQVVEQVFENFLAAAKDHSREGMRKRQNAMACLTLLLFATLGAHWKEISHLTIKMLEEGLERAQSDPLTKGHVILPYNSIYKHYMVKKPSAESISFHTKYAKGLKFFLEGRKRMRSSSSNEFLLCNTRGEAFSPSALSACCQVYCAEIEVSWHANNFFR